jgi:tRNA A37 methylthiotransferase MiaB
MDGQVGERTKKARAADLLALGVQAKASFARRSVGTETRVLLEQRLPDGRWVGHAEDHVLVAVAGRAGDPAELENAIARVRRTAVDPAAQDRVIGEIAELDPPARGLRASLPVLSRRQPQGA